MPFRFYLLVSGVYPDGSFVLGRKTNRFISVGRCTYELNPRNNSGVKGLAIPAYFSCEEDITKVFERIRSEWGGVRVLINNAGLGYKQDLRVV